MASAVDAAIQESSKALDTSGIGANTAEGLSLGMSLAQRQQQVEKQQQEIQFQQQQHDMQKHDWMHSQLNQAASENDPKLKSVLLDNLDDQFPKLFDGKRINPSTLELMKKSPTFMDKIAATSRVRKAMRTGSFDKISDFDQEVVNGMTSSDVSSQLGHLNTIQNQESSIIKALTAARVATPQAAAQAGVSQEELQSTLTQSNPMQARVTSQQTMAAQQAVNKDTLMNAYKMRLDGAARVNDLIQDAQSGKVKTNAAFLGQLNAEIARLETGSQSPGLGASEKTELVSAATQFEKLKEQFTGKPSDAVPAGLIKQVKGTMDSMVDSYQQAVQDRYSTLATGLTDVQKPIVKSKWDQDIASYSKRFGHWSPGANTAAAITPQSKAPGQTSVAAPQAPPKQTANDVEMITQQAKERLRQVRAAQASGHPVSFTEQQVKDTYRNLTGKDLVE